MTVSDFMAAMTTEVGLRTMDGSVLRRLSPNSSPAHWKSCDVEASGSRPDADPDTNTVIQSTFEKCRSPMENSAAH